MNKKLWLAAFMTFALVGSALTVFADQDQPAAGDDGGHPQMGDGGPRGMNIEKMKDKLGLTDDQVTKLKTLFESQKDANKALRDQMKIDLDTLQQKVDSKASDGDLKKALDALSTDKKAMDANRQKMEDQARQILTPSQQAKMVLGMMEHRGKMMKNWSKNKKEGKGNKADSGDSTNAPTGN